MVEDGYVCVDRRWYDLVVLAGGYLLVYFLGWSDVENIQVIA